jgi:IS5 family transposase
MRHRAALKFPQLVRVPLSAAKRSRSAQISAQARRALTRSTVALVRIGALAYDRIMRHGSGVRAI